MVCIVRPARLLGPLLFVAGLVSLAWGFLSGQATLGLVVIFPVVTATGPWSILGIGLLIVGAFVFFLTWSAPVEGAPPATVAPSSSPPSSEQPAVGTGRWGGVAFLGPFPVVFGSDPKVTQWMLFLGVALFVALLVLTVIALWGI